jgi:hypothetical protein
MSIFRSSRKPNGGESVPQKKERRLLPRWVINMPAKIRFDGDERLYECTVRDVNYKGISLVMKREFPANCSRIFVQFSESVFFSAEISREWQGASGGTYTCCLKYTRMYDAEKEKIAAFVRSNFPQYFKP